jgi:hypothetical protein
MKVLYAIAIASLPLASTGLVSAGLVSGSQAAKPSGQVVVVQAVPGLSVDVSIDGRSTRDGVGVGTVLGPFELALGSHDVEFSDASGLSVSSTVEVGSGSSTDIVIHRPAAVGGDPVVNSYSTPRKPIGPGKARVLVAHTATVAPADVRVDGQVVFTNIANGEYAEADVPAGHHRVELLPTGQITKPILGPLDITLEPRTVTMVYAVGTPKNGSMNVIAHTEPLTSNGSTVPDLIDTGSAGLAAHASVTPFSAPGGPAHTGSPSSFPWVPGALGAILVTLAFLGTRGARVRALVTKPVTGRSDPPAG